ncbi:MAG TPA: nucleotidyltransferase family protein [Flavisolibacter sp.]|nr:nucleotidyltransferase family protein [Flavisolibacter sp.]
MSNWKQHLVLDSFTIRESMIRLNDLGTVNADVFVVDQAGHLLGSVSDGDIRRALIKGAEVTDPVTSAMVSQCIFFIGETPDKEVVEACKAKTIRFLPLVTPDKRVIRIIDIDQLNGVVPVEAILMAGGEGKRLRPLTENLPKPLLPIGNKPIIEHNIDRLIKYGVSRIRISINYLGHMLQEYFADGSSKNIHIDYISEDKPMGTVGAVASIEEWYSEHILIMNSDLLTNIDYSDFYTDFINSNADLAIAAVPYHVNIPYAVLETESENEVRALTEKPTYTYFSNAGIYLLKRKVIEYIPKDCCYNMTDLIETLMKNGHKVISYPIRGYWLDIGKMNDYLKAQEDIKHLSL